MIEIIPNWHPVFVHFTIGLLSVSVVLFLAGALLRKHPLHSQITTVAKWNLWLGVLITIGTVFAGFYAFNTVEHGSETQHLAMIEHRNWALATAGLFIALAGWSVFATVRRGSAFSAGQPFLFLVMLVGAGAMLAVTGFKGGELVFRHGVGVMPVQQSSGAQAEGHTHSRGTYAHAEKQTEHEHISKSGETTENAEAMDNKQNAGHEEQMEQESGEGHEKVAEHAQTAEGGQTPQHEHTAENSQPDIEPAAGNGGEVHSEHMQHEPKKQAQAKSATTHHRAMGHESKPVEAQGQHKKHEQPKQHEKPMQHGGHGDHSVPQTGDKGHGQAATNDKHMGHDKKAMDHKTMNGFYGPYPMSREASGTAWVPDSSPMEGIHGMYGEWMTMVHGYANLIYDHQGGRRGDDKTFSESMLMVMAQRKLGLGTLGLRGMFSLDPLMGKDGYPLLLQTGETANGVTPLIDRQHPHDLLMELAASYSLPLGQDSSVFGYLGYPGEPALGPPTFMHRFSGMDNPEAPLGHHWLDSTHITFGVATLGYVRNKWKVEASVFNGREPDEERWNFDRPRFNSASGRISYNPTPNWSMQLSHGHLDSPEQLEPEVDQRRTTASVSYNLPFDGNNWQTTFAWGRNDKNPGRTTDAALLESSVKLHDTHTFFGRAEYAEKDELFEAGHPLEGQRFDVGKLSLGYIYDIPVAKYVTLGLGGLGSIYAMPSRLEPDYGENPASFMVFARLKLN